MALGVKLICEELLALARVRYKANNKRTIVKTKM